MAKLFHLVCDRELSGMARAVERYMTEEWRLETQTVIVGSGDLLVQGRPGGHRLRRWIGVGRAASVLFEELGGHQISMTVGSGQWSEAAEPITELAVLWPLDAAYGWSPKNQEQLRGGIEAAAAHYLYGP